MLKKILFHVAFLLLTNLVCLSVADKPVIVIPENANIAAAVNSARGADVEFDIQGIPVPRHGKKSLKVRATSAFGKDSTYRIDQGEKLPISTTRQVLVSSDDEESFAVISVDARNGGDAVGFMTVGHGKNTLFGLKQGQKGGVKASDPEAFTPPEWSCAIDDLYDGDRRVLKEDGAADTHHHDHGDEEQAHVHFKPGSEGLESVSETLKAHLRGRHSRRLSTHVEYEVKLFLEIDSAFYGDKGQSRETDIRDYVNLLVSAANKIYEKEIRTHLTIQTLKIYTTASDPYRLATDSQNALNIMMSKYAGDDNFGEGDGAIDIHHAFLGKNLGGGIAYLGVLCNKLYGFGLVSLMAGDFINDPNVQGTVRWIRDLLCRDEWHARKKSEHCISSFYLLTPFLILSIPTDLGFARYVLSCIILCCIVLCYIELIILSSDVRNSRTSSSFSSLLSLSSVYA
jgi:hypothetical protein